MSEALNNNPTESPDRMRVKLGGSVSELDSWREMIAENEFLALLRREEGVDSRRELEQIRFAWERIIDLANFVLQSNNFGNCAYFDASEIESKMVSEVEAEDNPQNPI